MAELLQNPGANIREALTVWAAEQGVETG
jgi:hypothetical protein